MVDRPVLTFLFVVSFPGISQSAGAGLVALIGWARRSWASVAALDLGVLASAWTAVLLLGRTPDFAPWRDDAIVIASVALLLGSVAPRLPRSFPRRLGAVASVAALTLATAGKGLNGNNVTAGPTSPRRRWAGRAAAVCRTATRAPPIAR